MRATVRRERSAVLARDVRLLRVRSSSTRSMRCRRAARQVPHTRRRAARAQARCSRAHGARHVKSKWPRAAGRTSSRKLPKASDGRAGPHSASSVSMSCRDRRTRAADARRGRRCRAVCHSALERRYQTAGAGAGPARARQDKGFAAAGRRDQTVVWFLFSRWQPARRRIGEPGVDTLLAGAGLRIGRTLRPIRGRQWGDFAISPAGGDQTSRRCRIAFCVAWSSCRPLSMYDAIDPYDVAA